MESQPIRLDRFLANQLGLARKEARLLCRQGRVSVDDSPARSAEQKVDPYAQKVCLDGKRISYRAFVYLMLYKPAGILSASRDSARATVIDLVPAAFSHRALFPVGRLDKDTTGLLLLTDDGDTAHRLLSPRCHVEKVYEALLDGPLPDGALEAFGEGIVLSDGSVCKPAGLSVVTPGDKPLVRVVLTEGMYHQIKRMFGVLGLGVEALHRVSMGPLQLDPSLAPGDCRELTEDERRQLLDTTAGEKQIR